MNPIFIYQNETTLNKNNKFSIDFADNEIVNFINFSTENQYYISSLDCNITKANKKKIQFSAAKKSLVDDLTKKSRDLLSKGASYQTDIGYLTSNLTDNYYFPNIAPQKYNFALDAKFIEDNCYKYKFFDSTDNRVKFAKIYSPFSHLKNGFVFKGDSNLVKNNSVLIQLAENYTKVRYVYLQDKTEKWDISRRLYRDLNAKFIKDENGKWWGISPNLI